MSLKNIVIGIAILIITISVVVSGIHTFYKAPNYEDYCGSYRNQKVIETQAQCEAVGGQWTSQDIKCITAPCPQGYCDLFEVSLNCGQQYDNANEVYSRHVFLIALPVGIAIIAIGMIVFGLEAVGAGLMGGGVGVILWGVGGFWRFADDWLKFLLSLAGLIILIWLAYFFNNRFHKGKFHFKKRRRR